MSQTTRERLLREHAATARAELEPDAHVLDTPEDAEGAAAAHRHHGHGAGGWAYACCACSGLPDPGCRACVAEDPTLVENTPAPPQETPDQIREAARREGYLAAVQAFHEAHPDHCGGECFRWSSIDSALAELTPGSCVSSVLDDPRVDADVYVIYPTGYEEMTCVDKDKFCLTVTNGHEYGWSIREGRGVTSSRAMNRKGEFVLETRGHGGNRRRRWPLEEAIAIALQHVDTRTVMGRTAADWIPTTSQPTSSPSLSSVRTPGVDA